ncbi:hypothetical protein CEXT_158421 [Caerostris extrusa]|uniref:Uncharacterized protein n=1 Tax=Caerostris extrusa TaxID=172846 RepID=A0AAV4WYZ5_CAEEX|nr:hypothetical protein CEXT_158421 [Caerostris extrusa]
MHFRTKDKSFAGRNAVTVIQRMSILHPKPVGHPEGLEEGIVIRSEHPKVGHGNLFFSCCNSLPAPCIVKPASCLRVGSRTSYRRLMIPRKIS